MEEKYRAATAKDLIEALRSAGLVTGGAVGNLGARSLELSSVAKALVADPQSAALGFVQLPGIFVRELPTEIQKVGQ